MKNVNYIINGVLAVAVIVLFVLHFAGNKGLSVTKTPAIGEELVGTVMPVAYVNVDSLLLKYNYAQDLYEVITKKQENARVMIGTKMQDLQKEVEDFQRKVQYGGFLTNERAQQEQARIMKKDEDLRELDERTTAELLNEQQQLNKQLRDSVVHQLELFNKNYGFQIVFSNTGGDNILLAGKTYDVTEEFLLFLNQDYSGASK